MLSILSGARVCCCSSFERPLVPKRTVTNGRNSWRGTVRFLEKRLICSHLSSTSLLLFDSFSASATVGANSSFFTTFLYGMPSSNAFFPPIAVLTPLFCGREEPRPKWTMDSDGEMYPLKAKSFEISISNVRKWRNAVVYLRRTGAAYQRSVSFPVTKAFFETNRNLSSRPYVALPSLFYLHNIC